MVGNVLFLKCVFMNSRYTKQYNDQTFTPLRKWSPHQVLCNVFNNILLLRCKQRRGQRMVTFYQECGFAQWRGKQQGAVGCWEKSAYGTEQRELGWNRGSEGVTLHRTPCISKLSTQIISMPRAFLILERELITDFYYFLWRIEPILQGYATI